MREIATKKKKPSPSYAASLKELKDAVTRMSEATQYSSEQVTRELASIRQDMSEMKTAITRAKERRSRPFRSGLFSRKNKPEKEEIALPTNKGLIPLEDLLPLLPQLSGMIPQLKSPKVAETMKLLANPAVISMIQQFINNGGLARLPIVQNKGRTLR